MIKRDCFAFMEDNKCTIMEASKLYCMNEKCSFYKTREKAIKDYDKAREYNEKNHNIISELKRKHGEEWFKYL